MNSTNDTAAGPTSIFERYPSRTALVEKFIPTAPLLERWILPLWYIIGLTGNPVSAIVWFGRRMRRNNSSAIYLGSLAVSDVVFLLLHLLYSLHTVWGYQVYAVQDGCEPFMFFFYVPQYLSVVLVLGFTVERYTAVCHPFLKEKWCTVRRACFVVAVFVVFSVALSAAQIYIWTYNEEQKSCNHRLVATEGEESSFFNIWTWSVDMVVFAALPLIVLVFNALVLREIIKLSNNGVITRQQSRTGGGSNNTASTLTLLSVSFYLIITQLAATIVNNMQSIFPVGNFTLTDEEVWEDPTWSRLFAYMEARKIVDVLCMSHFACYFFVYYLTGKHFRRELTYLITCHGKFQFLGAFATKTHKGDRYSMVSSNGHTMATETCTTAYTTSM